MPRKTATDPELTTVRGATAEFRCPDIATVDRHLKALRKKIRTSGSSEAVEMLLKDADKLLDRRAYLSMVSGG